MKKLGFWMIFGIAGPIMLVSLITGCGQVQNSGTTAGRVITADNPQIKKYNEQLDNIRDQRTAEEAVNGFLDYVDSRLAKPKGMAVQSLKSLVGESLAKEIARQEVCVRHGEQIKIFVDGEEVVKPLLDVGAITDTVNDLGREAGVRINDECVTVVKDSVEASLPALNPEDSPLMSPLNAMTVAYVMCTGDDGTATPESVSLPADKVGDFIENITQ